MGARYVVGALAIACFILSHVECLPRVGRDDKSSIENGSGDWEGNNEDDVGASDADYWSNEDDTNDRETEQPETQDDRGNSEGLGKEDDTPAPTALPKGDSFEESLNESDNFIGVSDEDIGGAGSDVSYPNKDVGNSNQDKPVLSTKDQTSDDRELAKDLEEEKAPSKSNARDEFFGQPEALKPSIADNPVVSVGIGAKRTDVMLVFDNNDDYGVYDDSQMTEDPEIVSLERGDYKRDDFFDTIGMKKLDDFIPSATETKKARDFIDGHTTSSVEMNEIFGKKSGSGVRTMKDDFFDSIGVKNIVTHKYDLNMRSDKKSNQARGSVSQLATNGPGSEMTFEEELKMQQLILRALRLFIGSPCYKNGRLVVSQRCAVFEDVLNAMALSGLTFNSADRASKPIATKSSTKWTW